MKVWFRIPASLFLSFAFVAVMAYINYHSDSFISEPTVAGATVTKKTPSAELSALAAQVNLHRKDAILGEDVRLNALAKTRLSDMLVNRYYAHFSPDGSDFADWLTTFGLEKTTPACENLLMTQSTDEATVVAEWLTSPGHKACMLQPEMNAMGSASAVFDKQTKQILFVTIYAKL